MDERWLVVGLGNPGADYERTRHNVGFLFLDYVVARLSCGNFGFQRALQGQRVTGALGKTPAVFVKPETYMNLSGQSVSAACSYFKILPEHTVICYDDVDIPFGTFRIRVKGSSGGHRGIASIIEHMGPHFVRIRFGIRPDEGRRGHLAGFVLSDFSPAERDELEEVFDDAFKALRMVVSGFVSRAMNTYNKRQAKIAAPEDGASPEE